MNYILTMSLSGSCMVLLYLGQKHIWRQYITKKCQYLFLKTAVLYYLIPLPFVGEFYRDIFQQKDALRQIYYHDENVIWQTGKDIVLSTGYQSELAIVGIWLLGVGVVLVMQWQKYRNLRERLIRYGKKETTGEATQVLENLKRKLKIRKKVTLVTGEEHTFTVGWQRPMIVWQVPQALAEKEMILEHELRHVKRGDLLWRLLGGMVTCMHWFNPLVYLGVRELEQLSEETCDELVIAERSQEERYRYAKLLIRYAGKPSEETRWKVALANGKKKLKERVELIMKYETKRSKWSGMLSVVFLGCMIFLNSLTALAYEEVHVVEVSGNISPEGLAESDFLFTPEGEQDAWKDIILYDEQFIDEAGNIYPVEQNVSTCATCAHTYVSGTLQRHWVNSSGGCMIYYYEGQRCSKCGAVIYGELISKATFDKCIH